MVVAEPRQRGAPQQAAGSLPWIGVDEPSEEQGLQADHGNRVQESANFQRGGLEKFSGADDPQHALQKKKKKTEAWQTCGTWMTATTCVTRSWCCPSCRKLSSPTPVSERSGTPRKTVVSGGSADRHTYRAPHFLMHSSCTELFSLVF